MHKRTKALDISQKVKNIVWERDNQHCIICGSYYAMPNAHYISRAKSGLGIPENIVTLCQWCHHNFDNSDKRNELAIYIKAYLDNFYPNFTDDRRTYKK